MTLDELIDLAMSAGNRIDVQLGVFIPIYLAESSTGELTASLFKVVTITLLCSWVLFLTMIPMLCIRFFTIAPAASIEEGRLPGLFRVALRFSLQHRVACCDTVLTLFVASMRGLAAVPSIFSRRPPQLFHRGTGHAGGDIAGGH